MWMTTRHTAPPKPKRRVDGHVRVARLQAILDDPTTKAKDRTLCLKLIDAISYGMAERAARREVSDVIWAYDPENGDDI